MCISTVSFLAAGSHGSVHSGLQKRGFLFRSVSCEINSKGSFSPVWRSCTVRGPLRSPLPVRNCAILITGRNFAIPFMRRTGARSSRKRSMALAMPLNIWEGIPIKSRFPTAASVLSTTRRLRFQPVRLNQAAPKERLPFQTRNSSAVTLCTCSLPAFRKSVTMASSITGVKQKT